MNTINTINLEKINNWNLDRLEKFGLDDTPAKDDLHEIGKIYDSILWWNST